MIKSYVTSIPCNLPAIEYFTKNYPDIARLAYGSYKLYSNKSLTPAMKVVSDRNYEVVKNYVNSTLDDLVMQVGKPGDVFNYAGEYITYDLSGIKPLFDGPFTDSLKYFSAHQKENVGSDDWLIYLLDGKLWNVSKWLLWDILKNAIPPHYINSAISIYKNPTERIQYLMYHLEGSKLIKFFECFADLDYTIGEYQWI